MGEEEFQGSGELSMTTINNYASTIFKKVYVT